MGASATNSCCSVDYIEDSIRSKRKLLLLGCSNSGKTTVIKSIFKMKDGDLNAFKHESWDDAHVARSNCFIAIKTLINACYSFFNQTNHLKYKIDENDPMLINAVNIINTGDVNNVDNLKEIGEAIATVWKSSATQYVFKQRMKQKFFIPENMEYWFNKVDILFDIKYEKLNENDIFNCWNRTNNNYTLQYYPTNNNTGEEYLEECLEIIDCGGSRHQRNDWIEYFYQTYPTDIIFTVSLTSYCTSSIEDNHKNDMCQSMQLFEQILNGKWFQQNTTIILLFTKFDLFQEYLLNTPLTFCFEEYDGPNYISYESQKQLVYRYVVINKQNINIHSDVYTLIYEYFRYEINELDIENISNLSYQFIKERFLSLNINENRQIYSYPVTTTDNNMMQRTFKDIVHCVCTVPIRFNSGI